MGDLSSPVVYTPFINVKAKDYRDIATISPVAYGLEVGGGLNNTTLLRGASSAIAFKPLRAVTSLYGRSQYNVIATSFSHSTYYGDAHTFGLSSLSSAGTITAAFAYYSNFTAAATPATSITTYSHFYSADNPAWMNIANVRGFVGAIVAGTGKYNCYMSGTAPNYFAGDLQLGKTVTAAGTTGAQTINKTTGRVNFAAGAASLVVTNSLCSADSLIQITVMSNDATMKHCSVVAAAGSFTIYADALPTAETKVAFLLTN